jgi:undecaprenyl-diphosphatase
MTQINLIHAIILGIVQGAAEFLPISSSAHLVIFQNLFKIDVGAGPIVAFDVCLHLGTAFAIITALWRELCVIFGGVFRMGFFTRMGQKGYETEGLSGGFSNLSGMRALWLILLGTIPAVIIGFTFRDFFENLFTTTLPVGIALICTGFILFATRLVKKNEVALKDMRWWHAVAVGLAQAVSIIPGISRSGSTISMGLYTGLDRQLAAKFSFLLSIVAIGGAALLEWKNLRFISAENLPAIIAGTLFSFITGYLCVRWMLAIMRHARFSWFAVYCWLVGTITIIFSLYK